MLDERDEFSERHQRGEEARQAELVAWEKDRAADSDKHRRELGNRDQVAERLATELEAAREHVARRNEDLALVQNQLRDIEDQHRKLGDETVSGQRSLELEIASLRRDLTQYEADLARARGELQAREQDLQARDLEVSNLIDTNREMDGMLATERKGRLTLSDKLDQRDKTVRQQERELGHLRDKLSSTEPRLSEMQSARSAAQRDTDRQKNELSDLLVTVLKDLNRFLGVDESGSTNVSIDNFRSFRTTLEQRLRSMKSTRADLERRVKESEGRMEQKLASLKRQLDTRWRVLDSFEASVKKLETQKAQWRDRLAQKDAELVRVRGQTREPAQPDVSAEQLKQLTERAQAAEARAKSATKAVTSLEERLAEIKKSSGTAEIKWEARVKEYESRMRQAEEKIKAGRQGGSERVRQLEAEARELKRQIDNLKNYNRRAEDVVARADK